MSAEQSQASGVMSRWELKTKQQENPKMTIKDGSQFKPCIRLTLARFLYLAIDPMCRAATKWRSPPPHSCGIERNLEPEQFCGDDERRFLGCENRKAVLFLFQVLCEFSTTILVGY